MAAAALLIALLSLSFSLWTYWRSQAMPARLEIVHKDVGPSMYGLDWTDRLIRLRIPVVIENQGARSGTLLDARLSVPKDWASGLKLELWSFHPFLDAEGYGMSQHPVAIAGHSAVVLFCGFTAEVPRPPRFDVGNHELVLAIRDGKGRWKEKWRFHLEIDDRAIVGIKEGVFMLHWNPADRGPLGA